jgi:hypothetical protein
MDKPSFDQAAKELRLDELRDCMAGKESAAPFQAAETRLLEKKAGERLPDACARHYALFRLLVDDKEGRLRWQALAELDAKEFRDRDSTVVEIWEQIELECPSEDFVAGHWSLLYHRLWLFNWLLRRYDVRGARKVMGGGSWARNAHFLLLAAVMGVFALCRLERFGAGQTPWVFFLCAGIYVSVLTALTRSFQKLPNRPESFAVATHSLIPRLAGAAAVGLLFLASSLEMFPVILKTKPWWLLALVAAVYGYLLLEMSWRIHPFPRFGRLVLHAFDISATALAHSLTLTLLAEGALRRMLANRGPFNLHESISLAVFVFSIGLVINLIWAEQPVTEPL